MRCTGFAILDVLNNLTSLEVLSMSGNSLEDKIFFDEGHSFGYLPNLTVLELDNNKFTKLPVEALTGHKKLKMLNVGHNKLVKYYPEFTELVKNGLDLEYEGVWNRKSKFCREFVLERNLIHD